MTVTASDTRTHPGITNGLMIALGRENVHTGSELRFGDYAFPGAPIEIAGPDDNGTVISRTPQVGIELCTVADFCGKITSGRLQYQMSGLMKTYNVRILMIQGDFKPDTAGKVSLYGTQSGIDFSRAEAILDSAEFHGIHVRHTRNPDHTLKRLIALYRWWQKDPTSHEFFQDIALDQEASGLLMPVDNEFDRITTSMAGLVRGLGVKRVEAALQRYPNVAVLTNLELENLKSIPGWGPKLSKDFYDACNHRWKTRTSKGSAS